MNLSFRFAAGSRVWPALMLSLLVAGLPASAAELTNALEIQSVRVDGKPLLFRGKENVSVGSSPENIVFGFGAGTNAGKLPLRLRHKLEGYDSAWQEATADMSLNVRFYNGSGDQISQNIYRVNGESTGWTGSLKTSTLKHRRETKGDTAPVAEKRRHIFLNRSQTTA